ncbi:hypothetical protein DFQ27_009728 [Actinomortierella ambigua]|uniref:Major facilitator superfamily (MFS) profile domain-containing protein n=1 Tax=Actinomortierella ambigua TaxID=1343610 RepID=A0A9P6TWN2_9FUNG|nr:hypothetical protein DFQ27_009728 [Actinomortierella ambigua]
MVSTVPVAQQAASERQPLLSNKNNHSHAKGKSLWYRARRAPLAVACVTAIALFVDMVVYGVVVPILPDIVKRLGGTSRDAGFLFACYAFGLLGSTPVFAYLSDHYHNRRYPMMGGMLGMAVATFCFANANSYWMLIFARTGQGMAGGASWTIGLGMLADVYPQHQLGVVMGICLMFNTIGFLIGPTMGGALYEYYGLHAPFAVCAALALMDFFAILLIAEPEKNVSASTEQPKAKAVDEEVAGVAPAPAAVATTGEEDEHDNQDNQEDGEASPKVANYGSIGEGSAGTSSSKSSSIQSQSCASSASSVSSSGTSSSAIASAGKKTGLEKVDGEDDGCSNHKSDNVSGSETNVSYFQIASEWTIARCLLATLVTASAYSGIEPIFPLHLQDTLGAGPALTGLVFTSVVVPSLCSPLIGYVADKTDRLVVSSVGMILFVSALIWLSVPTTIAGFILPLALFGLGSSMSQTPILPAIAQIASERGWNAYARVYACFNMVYSGGMMVGPILAGVLYDRLGFGWTMFVFGAIGLLLTPLIFGKELVVLVRSTQRLIR